MINTKIKVELENLELENNKLTKELDKAYMDMLKGIIDVEQYMRVSESDKNEISINKENIDNLKSDQLETKKIDAKDKRIHK